MFVNELNKNICARRVQRPTNLFDRAMPSRRQFSCKRVQSRTCSGYAERSRKSQSKFSCKRVQSRTCSGYAECSRKFQEKVHGYEHYIHCCVLMLTTTETTFLGNLQLPFCVRGGVYNTPRCLCCCHIKCKVVKFGVVSCCLCCRFYFYSFAK